MVRALCKFWANFFYKKYPCSTVLEFLCGSNALFGLSVDPQNRKLFRFKRSRGSPKSLRKMEIERRSTASSTLSSRMISMILISRGWPGSNSRSKSFELGSDYKFVRIVCHYLRNQLRYFLWTIDSIPVEGLQSVWPKVGSLYIILT